MYRTPELVLVGSAQGLVLGESLVPSGSLCNIEPEFNSKSRDDEAF